MRTSRASKVLLARRGGALVGVTFLILVLSVLSFSTLALSTAAAREQKGAQSETSARYLSSAGLSEAVYDLRHGGQGVVGSADAPVAFAGGEYFVERVAGAGETVSLISTGRRDGRTVRTQLVLRSESDGVFRWGAFGEQGVVLDQNATVDSYDSTLGPYADQATNGTSGTPYASTNGNVASNASILLRQNSRVYGDATPGPMGVTSITGNAVLIGSSTPGSEYVYLPPVTIPEGVSSGPLVAESGTSTSLAAGTHVFDGLSMEARSRIVARGPATLVFDSFVVGSNAQFLVDSSDGPVEVYVRRDFVLNSNALVASLDRDPSALSFNLSANNIVDPQQEVDLDEVDFDSNSQLFGTIYAPRASIDVNSNFTLYGAIVARRLLLRSYSKVHYDENLANLTRDVDADFQIVGWRVLPDAAQAGAGTEGTGGDGETPSNGL